MMAKRGTIQGNAKSNANANAGKTDNTANGNAAEAPGGLLEYVARNDNHRLLYGKSFYVFKPSK